MKIRNRIVNKYFLCFWNWLLIWIYDGFYFFFLEKMKDLKFVIILLVIFFFCKEGFVKFYKFIKLELVDNVVY